MGILDHLTCFLRNLYAGQEATVRILYGTTDWFKIPGSPPPCDAEESIAGGGANAELSADNQEHCLYPF